MTRKTAQDAASARKFTRQSIAADIAAFRKRGGRIEVLGNTPLRPNAPSQFRSSAAQRKQPTPLPKKTASG
jgi:hypothetical protein